NILVRDSKNQLQAMYPPTKRNRDLFENEHIVHSSNMAMLAPQALELAQVIYERKPMQTLRKIFRLSRVFRKNDYLKNLFVSRNTYSEDLPDIKTNCNITS
ncbi:MAG TPA: hypothetical protein ACFYD4_13760, partial [Candidatus Wunengus sp. YC61]|uniref:hypothetical protein n=1 Tax=Candidatus Wunengus sp. YC61 TaxID=3367698 RepID=UPI004029B1F3